MDREKPLRTEGFPRGFVAVQGRAREERAQLVPGKLNPLPIGPARPSVAEP